MNELTDQHRRVLCKMIGECRRTLTLYLDDNSVECSCGERFQCPEDGTYHVEELNDRTFTTWEDYGKCIEAITEQGNLIEFLNWFYKRWKGVFADTIHAWESMSPAARCREIADWWQERGKG